ncbi:MAG: hypothetical protein QOF09_5352 [Alphaproteobacteria bacterium]|jgi:hypothetical protein|nr:hypothetical protein [Alphaproteobacteria bacterium]
MDARVEPGHDAAGLTLNTDAAVFGANYFLTQITRVTDAFAASTPAAPDDGAT